MYNLLQDIQCKTALHYAIQEHRFETTKLLLHFGADPFLGASITQPFYFDLVTCSVCGTSMLFSFFKSCGSRFIESGSGYGSGSSISSEIFLNLSISKIAIYLCPIYRRSYQPSKRRKFINFFLCLCVTSFSLLTDPGTPLNPDPDPEHCFFQFWFRWESYFHLSPVSVWTTYTTCFCYLTHWCRLRCVKNFLIVNGISESDLQSFKMFS